MQNYLRLMTLSLLLLALIGIPSFADWDPSMGHKMHFPQLPDEVGWDVACMDPIILADDWQCSESGIVDDIHFWGSWRDLDGDQHGDVGIINAFRIQIYTDIPAEQNPDGYSKPGIILRDWLIDIANVQVRPLTGSPQYLEGWLDPTIPPPGNVWYNDHNEYYQYNIVGLSDLVSDPFIQDEGTIYWLGISAVVAPSIPQTEWGWKTTIDHFNDDAVVGEPPDYLWHELYEPPRLGIFDVAFDPAGQFAGGSGINYYDNGMSIGGWYFYENTGWWNIWFYDNPLSLERRKEIHIELTVRQMVPNDIDPGFLTLAVNYSTPEWPPGDPPPLPPLTPLEESLFVGRDVIFYEIPVWPEPQDIVIDTVIELFNPEWISIDVMGINFEIVGGRIYHECVDQQTGESQSLDLAFVITGHQIEEGACCYPDGSCGYIDNFTCQQSGGIWAGAGSMCMGDNNGNFIDDACEGLYPMGACCLADMSCVVTYQAACNNIVGAQWKGAGTDCSDLNGNSIADICEEEPVDTCDYYKAPYLDYAPAGMPDFDQKQDFNNDGLTEVTWCGPTALANCLWWFDSKFEPSPVDPRPFGVTPPNDNYPLVSDYTGLGVDDHDTLNVKPFVDSLALYCLTDISGPGTFIFDMELGVRNWLATRGLADSFTVTLMPADDFEFIRQEVLRSQDVILLLGFWEETSPGMCERIGGHYVTVAGTCTNPEEWAICISDPFFDYNEGDPPGPPHLSSIHNDAQFVSGPHGTMHHDKYYVWPATCMISPVYPFVFNYELMNYPIDPYYAMYFYNQNTIDPGIQPIPPQGGMIHTLLEFALIICPVEVSIPDIDVVPDTLDYERCINTDTTYNSQFQICNVGTGPLTIDSITCDLNFVTVSALSSPVINPSVCVNMDVSINTNGVPAGSYVGNLHIYSDDPDESVVDIPHFRIEVKEQDIRISPDSLTITQIPDTSIVYTSAFGIYNDGGCDLTYTITSSPSWATPTGVGPAVIPPGGWVLIDLTINTASMTAGTYIDSFTVASDDPDSPILYDPVIVLNVGTGPTGFEYLLGDANMPAGLWPPAVVGGDVTYLVNYFRGLVPPCFLNNPTSTTPYLYAAADVNGDCRVQGNDVTYLVNYFRGLNTLNNCPDYPPLWPPIPSSAPAGWPNCVTPPPILGKQVIPSETGN